MKLKALLLCEDVRFERSGTFSVIGVLGERITVSSDTLDIVFPKLAFLAVLGGLRGVEQLAFRQWIRIDEDEEPGEMRLESHDPEADEHNFLFTRSPMMFPGEGTYEIGISIEADGRRATYRYPFAIRRA